MRTLTLQRPTQVMIARIRHHRPHDDILLFLAVFLGTLVWMSL